ncbi:MAG: hypothetical protein LBE99_00735 [Puniceicoccales bacterium]|jgi:lipopolysaccharide export system protein LptA|nr:hypothetical protein [Puniceicoccales bacterium]
MKMHFLLSFISISLFFLPHIYGVERTSSTIITSDQMEMLKKASHNEFHFLGQVKMESKNFYGECEELFVYSLLSPPTISLSPFRRRCLTSMCGLCKPLNRNFLPWTYVKGDTFCPIHISIEDASLQRSIPTIGQIQRIIAHRNVFLETEDPNTGEIKRARSNKAVIYPNEGKMILTENPVVHCSQQGTFMGEKITFFKYSERVIVENNQPQQRATVILSEENFDL